MPKPPRQAGDHAAAGPYARRTPSPPPPAAAPSCRGARPRATAPPTPRHRLPARRRHPRRVPEALPRAPVQHPHGGLLHDIPLQNGVGHQPARPVHQHRPQRHMQPIQRQPIPIRPTVRHGHPSRISHVVPVHPGHLHLIRHPRHPGGGIGPLRPLIPQKRDSPIKSRPHFRSDLIIPNQDQGPRPRNIPPHHRNSRLQLGPGGTAHDQHARLTRRQRDRPPPVRHHGLGQHPRPSPGRRGHQERPGPPGGDPQQPPRQAQRKAPSRQA